MTFTIQSFPKVDFVKRINNFNYKKCDSIQKVNLQKLFKSTPVLVFENQKLSPEEHFDMCTWFDTKYTEDILHPFKSLEIPNQPQIAIRGKGFANINGVHCNIGIGEEFKYNPLWHIDVVGNKDVLPPVVSSMYMHEIPESGGKTLFASLENAFTNMTREDKIFALQTKVIYSPIHAFNAEYDFTGYGRLDKYWEDILPEDDLKPWNMKVKDQFLELPLFLFPSQDSTKPVIFLSPNKIYSLVLDSNEHTPQHSQEIVRHIMSKYIVTENNVQSVDYKQNDLVIFNNRKVIHSSSPTEEYKDQRTFSLLFLGTNEKLVEY